MKQTNTKRKERKRRVKKVSIHNYKSKRYCPKCEKEKSFQYNKGTGHSECQDCGSRLIYWLKEGKGIKPKPLRMLETKPEQQEVNENEQESIKDVSEESNRV